MFHASTGFEYLAQLYFIAFNIQFTVALTEILISNIILYVLSKIWFEISSIV